MVSVIGVVYAIGGSYIVVLMGLYNNSIGLMSTK